jgi:hypothetical protein
MLREKPPHKDQVQDLFSSLSPMLFILVMDILSLLVQRASEEGLLPTFGTQAAKPYDTMIFLRPDPTDITLILDILQLFEKAS